MHAHPDDESSKGAASTARYVAEGVDVHVATCTGGERGSILNPKMDRPDVLDNITEIRRQEMERARDILGVRQDWLDRRLTWFSGATGQEASRPIATLVVALFNHQTHHRGQVHAMLTAAGQQTGDTDLFAVVQE